MSTYEYKNYDSQPLEYETETSTCRNWADMSNIDHIVDKTYIPGDIFGQTSDIMVCTPIVRVIKKRNTANKKERRRTQSINNAFSSLRDKIPNVPPDTKLSKIKTLKLAILYIQYLVEVMDGDQDPRNGFRADLKPMYRKNGAERKKFLNGTVNGEDNQQNKGRTGWPQDVWASEVMPEKHVVN